MDLGDCLDNAFEGREMAAAMLIDLSDKWNETRSLSKVLSIIRSFFLCLSN